MLALGGKCVLYMLCVDVMVCRSLVYGNCFKDTCFSIGYFFASREIKVSGNGIGFVSRGNSRAKETKFKT